MKDSSASKGLFGDTSLNSVSPSKVKTLPFADQASGKSTPSSPSTASSTNSSSSLESDTFLGALREKSKKTMRKSKGKDGEPIGKDIDAEIKRAKKTTVKERPSTRKVDLTPELKEELKEHLNNLNKMDRTLEASLIARWKSSQILASAFSSRASENLLATIASTLWTINTDSVRALGGGPLKVIILNAEKITTMVAPIDRHTVIISISNPKSNIGLISMYLEMIAKKIAPLLESYI